MKDVRPSSLIKISMATALVGVFVVAYADLRREQANALADFTAEQSEQAKGYAEAMRARLDGIRRDLESASDSRRSAAVLQRVLDGEAAYRQLDVVTDAMTSVSAHDQRPLTPPLRAARDAVLASPDPIAISPPVRRDRERLRFFRLRSEGVSIVLLVDLDRLLAGMRQATDSLSRWIIVDDDHRWVELEGAGSDAQWRDESGPIPRDLRELLSRTARDDDGTMLVGRDGADALGLGHRLAVAGYASVPTRLGKPWSVALVTSARRMRDRGRFATWRLVASMAFAGLLVALFGAVLLRQQRQTQSLAHELALRDRGEQMIRAMPMGIVALDASQSVTAVNPYLAERGVVTAGSLSAAFSRAAATEIAVLDAMVREAHALGRPVEKRGVVLHLEERRDLDVYAIPVGLDCFIAMNDRTEVRALERTLARSEKLATIGTLAAGIAHELGTPLGIISGRAEQVMSRVRDDESAKKGVASILAQVDKVSLTIRQLLDFSRVRPIEATAVTPAQVLASASALLEHRFAHAGVTLHVDAPLTVAAISADPGQLEQILVNLLINACDACERGGTVWARALDRRDEVAFEIRDDGTGIAPEHLAKVFDPFFTTKKRGQGTGLGLSIVADIVKNHGGSIEIESSLGAGTTMRVLLPKSKGSP